MFLFNSFSITLLKALLCLPLYKVCLGKTERERVFKTETKEVWLEYKAGGPGISSFPMKHKIPIVISTIALHYNTLHYTNLNYTSPHYTFLYTTLHYKEIV